MDYVMLLIRPSEKLLISNFNTTFRENKKIQKLIIFFFSQNKFLKILPKLIFL